MTEHARTTPRMHAQGRTVLPPPPAFGLLPSPAPRQPPEPILGAATPQPHPPQTLVHQQQQQQHPQQQHSLAAVRVEIAALAASVNSAIVGMQAAVDGLTARLARLEKRMADEARRALESQRVVADHVESLWRAIDGSREATNWCWARITPAAEGVARMRVRLVGHQHHQHQPPRHTHDTPSEADAIASEPALAVRLGDGAWLCVRYPMVHAPDDAGARCVWMRTTLVDEADATMRPYWIKAYDLDAQVAFLADFTNVPPCFDAEPFEDGDDDSDIVDTDADDDSDHDDGDNDDEHKHTDSRADNARRARHVCATPDKKARVDADDDDNGGGDNERSESTDSEDDRGRVDGRGVHRDLVPAPILRDGPQPNAVARADDDDDDDDDTTSTDDGLP
ncbi:hypothetical protein TW95_gp1324 [Pandoravirus inopinatum]|uniref:Uncharacterized protein n=1 Tax=Pandoravirus inopinatum TaxID=1605721 RepID=A0A0B5IYU1_9VIRU|nr:hypothetical protein TW95_gp1324 [Pandoravirus inopinatum]AJF98058.1 hypothetical protein [Pandoravirus inopinatum]